MRIPPLHRRQSFQRFFAGIVIGFVLGWSFFLMSFGGLQEFYISEIKKMEQRVSELKKEKEIYQTEYNKMSEENKKKLRVQDIKVSIINKEKIDLKGLPLYQLENAITWELHGVLTKDIQSVAENTGFLIKALENKTFYIDQDTYEVRVYQMHLYTTLRLYLNAKRVK